jgi:predicted RNA-binding Zn-ribbon protein involved in translation (DUF1610 family)
MSETTSLVRVRRIDFVCDHCGEGSMSYTGSWWEIHSTGARMHYHRCDVCGFQAAFPVVYPRTEFLQEASQ